VRSVVSRDVPPRAGVGCGNLMCGRIPQAGCVQSRAQTCRQPRASEPEAVHVFQGQRPARGLQRPGSPWAPRETQPKTWFRPPGAFQPGIRRPSFHTGTRLRLCRTYVGARRTSSGARVVRSYASHPRPGAREGITDLVHAWVPSNRPRPRGRLVPGCASTHLARTHFAVPASGDHGLCMRERAGGPAVFRLEFRRPGWLQGLSGCQQAIGPGHRRLRGAV